MCLRTITETKTYEEEQVGWKVFIKGRTGLFPVVMQNVIRQPYPESTWITDRCKVSIQAEEEPQMYMTGFHIFPNPDDAQRYNDLYDIPIAVIRKVKYKGEVTIGTQSLDFNNTVPCVVAREMFITDEGKNWISE